MNFSFYYPVFLKPYGAPYACFSIAKNFELDEEKCSIFFGTKTADPSFREVKVLFTPSLQRSVFKLFNEATINHFTEFKYLSNIDADDFSIIWPGATLKLIEKCKYISSGLAAENINTHQGTAKRILDAESKVLGYGGHHTISDYAVDVENRMLHLMDYVFSPAPCVTQSLLENGVEEKKIIDGSYGLDEKDILDCSVLSARLLEQEKVPVFVMPGRIGVRKGVHRLLRYWQRAAVNAKLLLVGEIESSIKDFILPYLGKNGVEHIDFTPNLAQVLAQADVFVLPSLEEGSPLVTYLALGAGLPCLVSPMGSGGAVRDGVEGLIVDSFDEDAWIHAIRELAGNREKRLAMGRVAHERADFYLWPKVAKRRRLALQERMG